MGLDLNKSEESGSNANGNAQIGISSNANASNKPATSCTASSKPRNSSPVISFTGMLPHICYHQVTSAHEVIEIDDTSSEEEEETEESKPDLDLSLKLGQGEVIDVKQEDVKELSSSSVSSTDGQIQGETEERILILLGCLNCFHFVMVSRDNPSCPMCRKSSYLKDVINGKPFKKQKLE